MNTPLNCLQIQNALVEQVSHPAREAPALMPEVTEHLQTCPACRAEFAELSAMLATIDTVSVDSVQPAPELWTALECRLDTTTQCRTPRPETTPALPNRWTLFAQYAYVTTLGVFWWACLTYAEPYLAELLSGWGISIAGLPFAPEFAPFLVFLAAGGFLAVLAAPLLLESEEEAGADGASAGVSGAAGRSWFGALRRLFTGRAGLLGCF
jgi:anti-sigma factor RsiW